MLQVTALKWVPPFAQGQVRDHRVRWVLLEVGQEYEVDLIDTAVQLSAAYRAEQPFGQVPVLREAGRTPLFESGAIVWLVAERAGNLLPLDPDRRAQTMCWYFAAVNSIEPAFANVAEVDFFISDEAQKSARRPRVVEFARQRLQALSDSLGAQKFLVGDEFSVADLMMASTFKIVSHTDLIDGFPNLAAYRDRCLSRPAYVKAIHDQCEDFKKFTSRDMKYELRNRPS